VLVELGHAIVRADAVGDIDVARSIPGDVARPAEARARRSGAGRVASTTTSTATAGGTTAAATASFTSADRDRFRLAAEHERDAPFRIELHQLTRRGVDRPDVVVRIDAQANCRVEAVDVLSELAHELAGLIELEEPRSAVRERPVVAEGRVGVARARVDEDLSLRVGADAAYLTEVDVGGRLQQVRRAVEGQLGHRTLRDERSTPRQRRDGEQRPKGAGHRRTSFDAVVVWDFSRIFCERQSLISAVKMTSGS